MSQKCPYHNDDKLIPLIKQPEMTGIQADPPTTVGSCPHCLETILRCHNCFNWNRAFAQYCTKCSSSLEKPMQWPMAGANSSRTGLSKFQKGIDVLQPEHGFQSWSMPRPENKSQDVPSLLAFDGLILVPNSQHNRLEAFPIANRGGGNPKWTIPFHSPMTYANTPVLYGLHLYYVVHGAFYKTSVLEGQTPKVILKHLDPAIIRPAQGCAPMLGSIKVGKEIQDLMVFVLENYLLLYFPRLGKTRKYSHGMSVEDAPRTVVQCGNYFVISSRSGKIVTFKLSGSEFRVSFNTGLYLSAPVALDNKVYMEAIHKDSGQYFLYEYDPKHAKEPENKRSKKHNLEKADPGTSLLVREATFQFPPLTCKKQIILTDHMGKYRITFNGTFPVTSEFNKEEKQKFAPHFTLAVNSTFYSASRLGLTIFNKGDTRSMPLDDGHGRSSPPVTPPIRYGDKLFILCSKHLFCKNIIDL